MEKINKSDYLSLYSVQLYQTKKASIYYIRIPFKDYLLSFVSRKGIPKKGETIYVIQTKEYPLLYVIYEDEVPNDPDKGFLKIESLGRKDIIKQNENQLVVRFIGGVYEGVYSFEKLGKSHIWKMTNVSDKYADERPKKPKLRTELDVEEYLEKLDQILKEGSISPFIVAVDFDGTIVKGDPGNEPYPYVKEALEEIKELGGVIYIYSNRSNPEVKKEMLEKYNYDPEQEMKDVLDKYEIPYDKILSEEDVSMKVPYDFIIDDRSIPPFDGDWKKVVEHIKNKISEPDFEPMSDKFDWVKNEIKQIF